MSEEDFDEVKWSMEMGSLFYGDTDGSFFKLADIANRRKLKTAIYPPSTIPSKTYKVPDLVPNERRILSVDVALMATKKYKNDASAIIINSAIPTNDNNYIANIVYMENHEGLNTSELALVIRRLYKIYKCTDLVIDSLGAGLGVYDLLVQDMVDPETGELYQALSCYNDEAMAERCKVDGAPKEIWSIKGNASFNNEICILLRNGFKTGRINLLAPEDPDADDILKKKISGYSKMTEQEKIVYKMPYIQTSLLVNELVKLEYEIKGTNIKIKERSGMRKDRYSSLAYNYWVQCQLERELLHKANVGFDIQQYAAKMSKLNHRPTMY